MQVRGDRFRAGRLAAERSVPQTLQEHRVAEPDYILMTLGANPCSMTCSLTLTPWSCALESDPLRRLPPMRLDAFASVNLDSNMNQIFTGLVQNSSSHASADGLSVHDSVLGTRLQRDQLEMMESLAITR